MRTNMQPIAKLNFKTELGLLSLCANASGITHLNIVPLTGDDWQSREIEEKELDTGRPQAELSAANQHLLQAQQELNEYFIGERHQFDVKLAPKGTEFQRQVWHALAELDYGKSCSYAQIANRIDRPKAVRAVGAANGANPIAIIVPCHRVIGKNGALTGYAYGIELKRKLLRLEGLDCLSS
ncbi:methylated-DNA--[protein]-cysteine S-methyltransferase [uncultured Shewanella sp.]|uniref:methylated-DNA--[protein]-cysteine S-methyltransferase n=1 Tax=uncultured Shewanella sp. TaxID=173975 RepID=UPI00260B9C7F|nr:methylated-DNA--[protein]-cysteine S-methyltransferase [uncultured Shewanella sp.]